MTTEEAKQLLQDLSCELFNHDFNNSRSECPYCHEEDGGHADFCKLNKLYDWAFSDEK